MGSDVDVIRGPTTSDFTVSVIIPARDETHTIDGCLRSLAQQTLGPQQVEVIVVAAGGDGTADVARREGRDRFGRFEVLSLEAGNKNAALRLGCGGAHADTMVLLDADTELAPAALAELLQALRAAPHSAVHGAMRPRVMTWVSRYCEFNRKLVKDLHFDGHLAGGMIALPRAALASAELGELFPDRIGAADDYYLGLVLLRHGWGIGYAPRAQATTAFPSTLRGLTGSMLRNRRGVMAMLPWSKAAAQAARSALLLGALVGAGLAARYSIGLAVCVAAPLLVHAGWLASQITALRRQGLGDYRRFLPVAVALDLLGRTLKLWAFAERVVGRPAPRTFRGERPRVAISGREA